MSKGASRVPVQMSRVSETETHSPLLDSPGFEANSEQQNVPLLCPPSPKSSPSLRSRLSFAFKSIFFGVQPRFDARNISITGEPSSQKFVSNQVRNQKYYVITFLPMVLYEQFRFFFNFYFLAVALTQFYRPLQIGFLFTYVAPLGFVLSVTLLQEAYDDFKRWRRDNDINGEKFERLLPNGRYESVAAADIQVGHIVRLRANQRVPADLLLLRCCDAQSRSTGTTFIRTDQLDGETDWKLRRAVDDLHHAETEEQMLHAGYVVQAAPPIKHIYTFEGSVNNGTIASERGVDLEHTLWANTVVASGVVLGLVLYTGKETRATMNTSPPPTKVGLTDLELNRLTKLLFCQSIFLSFVLVGLKGFAGLWYIDLFRFVILFSSIIPISLKVNMDLAKVFYSYQIMHDKAMPGTVVRTTSIPEETGRISYLFSDKTGTLTKNEMIFKKLQMGMTNVSVEALDEIRAAVQKIYAPTRKTSESDLDEVGEHNAGDQKRWSLQFAAPARLRRLQIAIESLALCHSVTPVVEEDGTKTYQAASPDEIALVRFTESCGVTLSHRTHSSITITGPDRMPENIREMEYEILHEFPFTSERKRMGIVLRRKGQDGVVFLCKGADSVMRLMVQPTDWLDEECENLAREGLRTLVIGRRSVSEDEYQRFNSAMLEAKASMVERAAKIASVLARLECDLETVGVTGVEDLLQTDVRSTLETLRNAGIRVWMLTGDKVETATCVALSSRLVARPSDIVTIQIKTPQDASKGLNRLRSRPGASLVIDGDSVKLCLDHFRSDFIALSSLCPAVAVCRCSPTLKAEIVTLIKDSSKVRVAAIGDGGNDVSMIQAAHVGIGIVGKEGKQASLASDFSIDEFRFVKRLLIWHGRNSYIRTSSLSQFVIHRGLIISILQAVFSAVFYFAPVPIYTGWLMVGYGTVFTSLPVFALVLDTDVSQTIANTYPELYKELVRGRSLSTFTFLCWQIQSIFQGGVIMILAIQLFENSFVNIVAISFTSLILIELMNVALEVHRWHPAMLWSLVISVVTYIVAVFVLTGYFDLRFFSTAAFWWKVGIIVFVSMAPVMIIKYIRRKISPPVYSKLR